MLQLIGLGTTAGDRTGTKARLGGEIINSNFAYLEDKIDKAAVVTVEAGYSLAVNVVTFNTGSQWTLNGSNYTNPAAVAITIPFAAAGKLRIDLIVYNTSNTFTKIPGAEVTATPIMPAKPLNTIKAALFLVSATTVADMGNVAGFNGSIIPSSTPTGTGKAFWLATQNGTYTNFGGVVVAVNSFAVISRSDAGVFSVSATTLDLTAYKKIIDNVKIETWTAKAFASGDQVTSLGKDWICNADTLTTDIPGTSIKWVERLSGYQINDKTYTDLSGWLFVNIDANNNIGFGIDSNGVFQIFTKLKVGGYEILTEGTQFILDYKANNPSDYTNLSGYVQANIDASGKMRDAVDLDGVWNIFMQLRKLILLGNYEIKTETTYDLAQYLNVWTDSANKILMGLKSDLSFEAGGINLTERVVKSRLIDSVNAWIFQKHVNGKTIIQAQSKLNGTFQTLSKTNCQNYNPSTSIDGLKTIWTTDDNEKFDAPLSLVYKNTDGSGNIEQVLPSFAFGGFGDSLLAGTGDDSGGFFVRAMTSLSIPYLNLAVGGQNSNNRGVAVGFLPMTVTVTGNSIPASGTVAITSYNITPFNVNGPYKVFGTLCGVDGWISSASSGTVLTFNILTPLATATSCPAGSLFIPSKNSFNAGGIDRFTDIRTDNMMWIWEMHNDSSTSNTIDNFNLFRNWIKPINKRIIVIGRTNDTYSSSQADSNTLKSYYLSQKDVIFIDAMALALANANGTAGDLAAVAGNWMPPSLTTDTIHYNPTFHAIISAEIVSKITAVNWNTKY